MARSGILTVAVALGAVMILAGSLSACGSSPSGSASGSHQAPSEGQASSGAASPAPSSSGPSPGPSSPVTAAPPMIMLVRLGVGFTPAEIRLGVGQHFQLAVSKNVQANGLGVASGCALGATGQVLDGLLSVRCTGNDSYFYTALRAGSDVLAVTVQPRCRPGTMCAQWVARATLKVIVT